MAPVAAPGGIGSVAAAMPGPTEQALDDLAFGRLTREIGADGVAELVAMFAAETRARLPLIGGRGLDHSRLLREVHSLRGAAAAACAVALSRRAESIEQRLKADDTLVEIDIAPLSEAFDAWRTAVDGSHAAEAIAA